MLELPEIFTVTEQIRNTLAGKTVTRVLPPTNLHKFCWFNGEPSEYEAKLKDSTVTGAEGFGIFAEIAFSNGSRLCFNEGTNALFIPGAGASGKSPAARTALQETAERPEKYQLLIEFADSSALAFTVAMYGGIIVHNNDYENDYYRKSRNALSPFGPDFPAHYYEILDRCKPALSAKAFLATEQRFPGIGNGVLQDILLNAGIHPKRKISTLGPDERAVLLEAVTAVLHDMTEKGGRDTEKDLSGKPGGYRTKMSRNTVSTGCPLCAGPITKETYLGGAVYYCPACQK